MGGPGEARRGEGEGAGEAGRPSAAWGTGAHRLPGGKLPVALSRTVFPPRKVRGSFDGVSSEEGPRGEAASRAPSRVVPGTGAQESLRVRGREGAASWVRAVLGLFGELRG